MNPFPALLLAGLLTTSASAGTDFDFLLAATRQDASMDWWYALPQPFAPKLQPLKTAPKGEYFSLIPVFRRYAVDSNDTASIVFDLTVRRPDGGLDSSLKRLDGFRGVPPSEKALLPARAVVRFCFDDDDPLGNYVFEAVAVDEIAHATNRRRIVVEHVPFAPPDLSEETCESLFLHYPERPDPVRAFAAFLQTRRGFVNEEGEPVWAAIWFYKTVFKENEFLLPHLLEAFEKGDRRRRLCIVLLLVLLNETDRLPALSPELEAFRREAEKGHVPDPYAGRLKDARQLDLLWAEFFATGRVEPIRRFVAAFDLADVAGTLEKIKAGTLDFDDPEVRRDARLEAVFQAALWSMRSNLRTSSLLFRYAIGLADDERLPRKERVILHMLTKDALRQRKEAAEK